MNEKITMNKMIKRSLTEVMAKPLDAEARARLAALAALPDAAINFTDQEDVTAAKITAGHYVIVRRGGARVGAGRKPAGKLGKHVRLSPLAIKRFQSYAKKRGLNFSAAIEAASEWVK